MGKLVGSEGEVGEGGGEGEELGCEGWEGVGI